MKKFLSLVLALGVVITTASGCQSGSNENNGELNQSTPSNQSEDSGSESDLVIMSIDATLEGYDEWIALAEETTDLNIEVIAAPTNTDDRQAKFTTLLSSGDSSVDLFTINDEMMAGFVKTDFLQPLQEDVMTKEVLDMFPQDYMNVASVQGDNVYGVPIYLDVYLFWVNQKILDKTGATVPTNLDEFKDFLEQTTGDGVYGYGGAWERTYYNNELTHFINMFGGDYYDWSNEGTIEAVKFMKEMVDNGYTPVSQMADQYDQLCQKISDGTYASMFCWTGVLPTITAYGEDQVHEVMMPVFVDGVSQLAAWQWVLSSSSVRKEAAYKFLNWAADVEAQRAYSEYVGKLCANLDVINDESFEFPTVEVVREYFKNYSLYSRPFPPECLEHIGEVGSYFQQYINNEISLEEFCQLAQESVNEYFELN